MSNERRKNSPHELVDLILKHDPNASTEMIAEVISEWGDIFDNQKFGEHEPINIESASPIDQSKSGI